MKLIVCLDEQGGMMFNHRRQSRDRVLIGDMIATVGDGALFVSPYSLPLFEGVRVCHVADVPLAAAAEQDFCFVEDTPILPFAERIDTVILYRFGRAYPADVFFPLDLKDYQKKERSCFEGSSHKSIIKEVYEK